MKASRFESSFAEKMFCTSATRDRITKDNCPFDFFFLVTFQCCQKRIYEGKGARELKVIIIEEKEKAMWIQKDR